MTCFAPMQAVQVGYSKTGKRKLKFIAPVMSTVIVKDGFTIPCGQCCGCRLERSRQWAMRIMHESKSYDFNCFITLTFNPDFLPKDGSLNVRYFQLFIKRLRKAYPNLGIRYFHCGEYGDLTKRPHYHACLFGIDFDDKKFYKRVNDYDLFTSETLSSFWADPKSGSSYGFCSIGSLTFASAAYVARYIMKKITGDLSYLVYTDIDPGTGEFATNSSGDILIRKSEYVTMSRRPGIGKAWFDKYGQHTYDWDYVIMNGRKVRPPKYYDHQYELIAPDHLSIIKESRLAKAEVFAEHNTPERLAVRERLQKRRLKLLPRKLDGEY